MSEKPSENTSASGVGSKDLLGRRREVEIGSHDLAKLLLALPNRAVFRHTDDDSGILKPLSHVEEVVSCDEDGEPQRRVIVIDTALVL